MRCVKPKAQENINVKEQEIQDTIATLRKNDFETLFDAIQESRPSKSPGRATQARVTTTAGWGSGRCGSRAPPHSSGGCRER